MNLINFLNVKKRRKGEKLKERHMNSTPHRFSQCIMKRRRIFARFLTEFDVKIAFDFVSFLTELLPTKYTQNKSIKYNTISNTQNPN